MKRLTPEHIHNIIFTVAVVIACAIISVIAGRQRTENEAAEPNAAPTVTAMPEETPDGAVRTDDVLLSFVSYGYLISETSAKNADWIIKDVPQLGTVYLSCAKADKRVISLSLRILAPPRTTPKPGSAIEQVIGAEEDDAAMQSYAEAVTLLLTAAGGALSGEDAFDASEIDGWAECAMLAMAGGKAERLESGRAAFTAVPDSGVQQDAVVCTITLKTA